MHGGRSVGSRYSCSSGAASEEFLQQLCGPSNFLRKNIICRRKQRFFSKNNEARLEIVQQQLHVRLYIFLLRSAFHDDDETRPPYRSSRF